MEQGSFRLSALVPDLSKLGDLGSAEGLTALSVVVIGLFGLIFSIAVAYEWLQARRRVLSIASLVKDAESETLAESYRSFKTHAKEMSEEIGHLWNEFHESLVYVESGHRVHNTLDASHFFNTYSLSRGLTDNRLLAAVPGLLTALGVMGTFAGLQMGLGGLDLSSGEVETLIDGIKGMISGASIAFASSFWGVFASVCFNFIEKVAERDVRGKIAGLQNRLDHLFPRITAEYSLREIQDQTARSTEALQGMAERIGDKMQEAMVQSTQQIRAGLEESLQTVLAPALAQLTNNAQNSSQLVIEQMTSTFAEKLGGHVDAQRAALSDAAAQMRSAIGDMGQRFSSIAEEQEAQQHRIASNIEGMIGRVSQTFDAHASTMAARDEHRDATVEQLAERMESTVNRLGDFQSSFELLVNTNKQAAITSYKAAQALDGLGSKFEGLSNGLTDATELLGRQISESISQVTQLAESNAEAKDTVVAMIETARALNEKIHAVLQQAEAATRHSNDGMQAVQQQMKQAQDNLRSHVNELRESIQGMMDEYAQRVKTQTVERMREWNDQTDRFAQSMVNAVQAIQDVVEEIEAKSTASSR